VAITIPRLVARGNHPEDHADSQAYLKQTGRSALDIAHGNAAQAFQAASPLARRPYDLRHAAVSLWLNGGVSPTEIAKRAGHSVEVLLRVYAKCVDGQEEITNHRIEEILGPVPIPETDKDQEHPQAS
jgi:hypothetical protein